MFGNLHRFGTFCHLIIEQGAVQRHLTTKEMGSWEIIYFEFYQSDIAVVEKRPRNGPPHAENRQVSGLLPGGDLRRFSGRGQSGTASAGDFSMGSLVNLTCLRQKRPRLKLNAEEYAIIRSSIVMDGGSMKVLEVHHMKRWSQLDDDVMHNLIVSVVTGNITAPIETTLPDRTRFRL
jgi:hypothetical protein